MDLLKERRRIFAKRTHLRRNERRLNMLGL
jgi:hypothetical protein